MTSTTRQSNRLSMEISGNIEFDPEDRFEYQTSRKGGIRRRVESIYYRATIADPNRPPHYVVTYKGHNVRKDGSLGANFRDSYVHHNFVEGSEEALDFLNYDAWVREVIRAHVVDAQAEFGRKASA